MPALLMFRPVEVFETRRYGSGPTVSNRLVIDSRDRHDAAGRGREEHLVGRPQLLGSYRPGFYGSPEFFTEFVHRHFCDPFQDRSAWRSDNALNDSEDVEPRPFGDVPLGINQHDGLATTVVSVEQTTRQIAPDLVFTANAALVFGLRCVLSQFRHAQRQGEEPHFAAALRSRNLEIVTLPDDLYFEGAGDALFCAETLFGGYRIRSTALALQRVSELIARQVRQVIPLELVDPKFYHLDTCLCPLPPDRAIWFPGAFDTLGGTSSLHVIDLIHRRFAS
jgi:hypothetical protein